LLGLSEQQSGRAASVPLHDVDVLRAAVIDVSCLIRVLNDVTSHDVTLDVIVSVHVISVVV